MGENIAHRIKSLSLRVHFSCSVEEHARKADYSVNGSTRREGISPESRHGLWMEKMWKRPAFRRNLNYE